MRETYRGSTSRAFSLAHDIDVSQIVATLENAALNLTLSKREGSRAAMLAGTELRLAAPRSTWPDETRLQALSAAAARAQGRFFLMQSADGAVADADAVLVAGDLAPAALAAANRRRILQAMLLNSLA